MHSHAAGGMAPFFGADLRRKTRFIRFVTATDRCTSAGAAIVPAPALSGAVPPAPAPGAPRYRSALRQPAQLIAQIGGTSENGK